MRGAQLSASVPELLGILVACTATATALVADDRRVRSLALVIAFASAPLIVAGSVWDEPRVADLRESPLTLALGLIVVTVALAATTVVFRRYATAFPIAAFAVLALRVPLEVGGEEANLLVPLYLVIAAGVATYVLDARGSRAVSSGMTDTFWPLWLRRALAATLVLYAIQTAYSDDVSNAIEDTGFFLVPFAVMAVLLSEVTWTRRLLGRVLIAIAAVALACALVAIGQYAAGDLFLNPELFDSNQLHVYFRVNSIFFDPNILGRYLALAIVALGAFIAWQRDRREPLIAVVVCGVLLVALAFTYSITSLAALIAGLGVVALLRWSWRGALAAVALGLVALAILVAVGGTPTSDIQDYRSIDSGRESLVDGGLELFGNRPLVGYGSGAFGQAFFDEIEQARSAISHSEPITVAAEQGVIGLVLYAALLVTAVATLFGGGVRASLARCTVAACFAAILVHSLGYAGFLTDPATWALLGLGIALRRDPPDPSATIQD